MDKSRIVRIPNATEEVRIGYSFNYLIRVIAETEAADAVLWDLLIRASQLLVVSKKLDSIKKPTIIST
jgi:hypothetical protein